MAKKGPSVQEAREALMAEGRPLDDGGLLDAARRGDAASLELYLAAGFSPRRAVLTTGRSPLVEAARSGSDEVVDLLLSAGEDPAE